MFPEECKFPEGSRAQFASVVRESGGTLRESCAFSRECEASCNIIPTEAQPFQKSENPAVTIWPA